jgi:hypothetical protein
MDRKIRNSLPTLYFVIKQQVPVLVIDPWALAAALVIRGWMEYWTLKAK